MRAIARVLLSGLVFISPAKIAVASPPQASDPEFVKTFLKRGSAAFEQALASNPARVNAPVDKKGNRPLALAVAFRRKDLVQSLLRAGADPNLAGGPDDRVLPLQLAVMLGHLDMVDVLLKGGADPDRRSKQGQTALIIAISLGGSRGDQATAKMVDLLLKAGADRNLGLSQPGKPPLRALDLARQLKLPLTADKLGG